MYAGRSLTKTGNVQCETLWGKLRKLGPSEITRIKGLALDSEVGTIIKLLLGHVDVIIQPMKEVLLQVISSSRSSTQ